MGVEVERKYLVVGDAWREQVASSTRIVQGYLVRTGPVTVRVQQRNQITGLGPYIEVTI